MPWGSGSCQSPPRPIRIPPNLTPEEVAAFKERIEKRREDFKTSANRVYIHYIEVSGPYEPETAPAPESIERIFVCGHTNKGHNAACSRKIVGNLARRAFRGPWLPPKSSLSVVSGLDHHNANSLGDGGGDDARAGACFRTGIHLKKTAGADIHAGVSVDQIAAQQAGVLPLTTHTTPSPTIATCPA